jgi:hypothetical protein
MSEEAHEETYNPWTVVNAVFAHLAEQGLHPVLGESGDPGAPAADLLRALGITPSLLGDSRMTSDVRQELADLRATLMDDD